MKTPQGFDGINTSGLLENLGALVIVLAVLFAIGVVIVIIQIRRQRRQNEMNNAKVVVAFTGTQRGMTPRQIGALRIFLSALHPSIIHNGACIGADEQAAFAARDLNLPIELWPSTIPTKSAIRRISSLAAFVHPASPPLDRNRLMVDRASVVIACPGERTEQQRSGTWSTIRYAQKMRRSIFIIFPEGDVEKRK